MEVMFFEPGEEPVLDCHSGGKCNPDICELFGKGLFELDPLPCTPIAPIVVTPVGPLILLDSAWF